MIGTRGRRDRFELILTVQIPMAAFEIFSKEFDEDNRHQTGQEGQEE